MAAKLKRKEKGLSLDTFELTDSAARNVLISTVKQMFEKGTIHTLAAAEQLIGQIQDGEMDKVDAARVTLEKINPDVIIEGYSYNIVLKAKII